LLQRQAVLQAVHAARVFGHVAADGAGDLAAGVGRVVQAEGRGRFADGQVAHAALHPGRARHRVDAQDPVELGQAQRHAQLVRQGAAGQAGAGAARHHRHSQRVAGLQHGGDLGFGLGQHHHQRPLAVGRQAVALVGRGVLAAVQDAMPGQGPGQRSHHLGAARGKVFDSDRGGRRHRLTPRCRTSAPAAR
jgi:hypothetical protein